MNIFWDILCMALAVVIVGWALIFYVVGASRRYVQLAQDAEKRLWPPGWLFLAFLPFLGQRWSDSIEQHTENPVMLTRPSQAKDLQTNLPERMTRYILMEEQQTVTRSEQYGMRLIPLNEREYKLVTPIFVDELQKDEILIQLSRPAREKIIWGKLKLAGNSLRLENTKKPNVVPVFRQTYAVGSNESLERVSIVQSDKNHLLNSGERFLIGLSEFRFIRLPCCQLHWSNLLQPELHGNWILNTPRLEIWKKENGSLTTTGYQDNQLFGITEDLQLTFLSAGHFSVQRIWSNILSRGVDVKANQRAIIQPGERFGFGGYYFAIDYLMDGK